MNDDKTIVAQGARPVLDIRDFSVELRSGKTISPIVDKVNFEVHEGRTLGIVGESGCGKSMLSLGIMKLVPSPPACIAGGKVLLDGTDLVPCSEREMQEVRGNRISMIFQEPMTSLNPVYTVGFQIIEALRAHSSLTSAQARSRAIDLLREVGISNPEKRVEEYPHRLSGGMRQRVMIAIALACNPRVLIADEPTTALDVTIQAQILDLMRSLKSDSGTAIILISHDLGVIAEMADDVVVMYAGRIIEQAPVHSLFAAPSHPYTQGLLGSMPTVDGDQERLQPIPGTVPPPHDRPHGCAFHPRCKLSDETCRTQRPPLEEKISGHKVACWHTGLGARP
ncbi:ABC transporter ATP-binding protein [Tianweitania sediminis]|uniref:ABC transporter ATP-binding protein n=1 Tax=Tianweitania sediminis TaxID=1502156 RepID=A0A8J7RK70_9HYPH|nr:ABC transporter ATP-binding protein [Tianweitania sediminis]MBP0439961.1 ABC transporter ATP-binding protein [Tianweitania sediminis]